MVGKDRPSYEIHYDDSNGIRCIAYLFESHDLDANIKHAKTLLDQGYANVAIEEVRYIRQATVIWRDSDICPDRLEE